MPQSVSDSFRKNLHFHVDSGGVRLYKAVVSCNSLQMTAWKRNEMKNKKQTCMYPDCKDSPDTRGLCRKHYQAAWQLVRDGKTSWDRLEGAGKAGSRTSQAPDWFLEETETRS